MELGIHYAEIKNKIEGLQNEHHNLKDAYKCLEVEKLKLIEKDHCREKKRHEAMEEAKAWDKKGLLSRLYDSLWNPGSSKGSTTAILNDIRAEKESLQKKVDVKTSELNAIHTNLTAKDNEVKLLEEKVSELQGAFDQEQLKHDSSTKAMRAEKEILQKEVVCLKSELAELKEMQTAKNKEVELERANAQQNFVAEKESLQKEFYGQKSELCKMQTTLTANDEEVESERANAQNLAAGKASLQKEVQDTKSELWEMQTKPTTKAEEVELEPQRTEFEEKVFKLQGALEPERLKHDAQIQHQSDETAQDTPLSSEAQHTRRDLFRATAESLQKEVDELKHKAESLQKEVDEIKQSKKKDADELSQSLQAVTQERDCHREKAESSQKELNEIKHSLAQLLQATSGTTILTFAGRRNDESCPSGASTQAEAKADV
jgi:chromosome segregation ATPase